MGNNKEEFAPVVAKQDNEGHWYILPNHLKDQFNRDLEDESMIDSGEFGDLYEGYSTGGDLNLIQLYIKKQYYE